MHKKSATEPSGTDLGGTEHSSFGQSFWTSYHMYTYIYNLYIYTYVCTHICIRVYTCVYIYTYIYIHICIYMCNIICTYVHVQARAKGFANDVLERGRSWNRAPIDDITRDACGTRSSWRNAVVEIIQHFLIQALTVFNRSEAPAGSPKCMTTLAGGVCEQL